MGAVTDYYDWTELKLRAATVNGLRISAGIVPNFAARSWRDVSALSFQVDVPLYISSPTPCPKAAADAAVGERVE